MKDWQIIHPRDVRVGNVISLKGKMYEVKSVMQSTAGTWVYGTKNGPDLTPTNPEGN